MLSDTTIKNAKARKKQYKIPDEGGLYLLVYPNGRKGWRFRYRFAGKDTMISLGNYPGVSLKKARKKRNAARVQVDDGINPASVRKEKKAGLQVAKANSFEAIAKEWLESGCPPNRKGRTPNDNTIDQLRQRLELHIYPRHGKTPIRDITVPELHATFRRMVSNGIVESAHRARSVTSRIFRYAIATGRADRDPAADLKDALPSVSTTHFPALTDPTKIGELLRAIDGYEGQPTTRAALRLAPYVFVRPTELRSAEWQEIDMEAAEWRIPASKTKMGRAHLVPLSRQAVAILRDLHELTGDGRLLFPSMHSKSRPITGNTLNGALRRLDYKSDELVMHGFRSMASTRLNELGYDMDLIEVQLAHMDRDRVRAIYNRLNTESYIAKRRDMMQGWADYLDGLRTAADVVAIRGAKG